MSNQDEQGQRAGDKDTEGSGRPQTERPGDSRGVTALDDLAGGLDLVLSAAKKALRGLEPRKLEELGRRAKQSLEQVDRGAVRDLGRRAAESLDPKHIEQIANEAGKELLGVVERMTERVETALGHGKPRPTEPPPESGAPTNGGEKTGETKGVRVEE